MGLSPDGDTDFVDTIPGDLQGDRLGSHLFTICPDYEHRTSIDLIKK